MESPLLRIPNKFICRAATPEIEVNEEQLLQHTRSYVLYPKQPTLFDDEELEKIPLPYDLLSGEFASFIGRTSSNLLVLSNYRLYHHNSCNIPLGLIDSVEVKYMDLFILGKDATICRLSFTTNEKCIEWSKRVMDAILPTNVEESFAFAMYAWAHQEWNFELLTRLGSEKVMEIIGVPVPVDICESEVERLNFDVSRGGPWRISTVNDEYLLCESYPRKLIVPASVSDATLLSASKFRTSCRIPTVVWRHKRNRAVIARSSQPAVGFFGYGRSHADELIINAILNASSSDIEMGKKLLIIDARSFANAYANRTRGGGVESLHYYTNCEVEFMNLANIHEIRTSFESLRSICGPDSVQPDWFNLLDNTKWLKYISGVIHAAILIARTVENDGRPVLVHCTDGWDRTPQIVSLAQLLLDPYYRTFNGFRVLVEREWIGFGHKFADRCGITPYPNERSPIFLQWLDCIHNIAKQFPYAFQMNSKYFVKLAQHVYSRMFGTFLCNNSRERSELTIEFNTFSVWSILKDAQYVNSLYSAKEQVLWPSSYVRDLELWREVYFGLNATIDSQEPGANAISNENQDTAVNMDIEFTNGEDLNGNGEEQNNQLEETVNTRMRNAVEIMVERLRKSYIKKRSDFEHQYHLPGPIPTPARNPRSASTSNKSSQPMCTMLDPLDGLNPLRDKVHERLTQLLEEQRVKQERVEADLFFIFKVLLQKVCHRCNNQLESPEQTDDDGTRSSSDGSWEAVEVPQVLPTLWIPDHAVSHCMGCNNQFWMGRRKHHCRNCGKVFCADCTQNVVPLPEEQLYEPVRVCANCYSAPSKMPELDVTTCKQAAGNTLPSPSLHTHA